jgi:hypothetical protein
MPLYHYCPNEAFHSIISKKEIRLSSLSLSNDYMEGKIVERAILNLAKKNNLTKEQLEVLQFAISKLSLLIDGLGF